MQRIASLLFATTLLSIFTYLIIFVSVGQAGNGGEYWGFDGYIDPREASVESFEQGDYRFLAVAVKDTLGKVHRETPAYTLCVNHPYAADLQLLESSGEPIHGPDSVRLATQFAYNYNDSMMWLLTDIMNGTCRVAETDA